MAKRKIDWSVEAKSDLLDILNFYNQRNGTKDYSRKLFLKIIKSISLLPKVPYIGKQTDFESVRVIIKEDYQIFYEIFDQIILVIMIWDCRNNPEQKRLNERIK